MREMVLHAQAGERLEDPRHVGLRNRLIAPSTPVDADPPGAQRGFGLLVEADRGGGGECDAVAYQVGATVIKARAADEVTRGGGAFHLETQWASGRLRQAEVVQ